MADKNPVELKQLLEFGLIFPNETPLTPEEYLRGGNKDVILNIAAFFLGFNSFNSKFGDNKTFISKIFNKENTEFANEILKKIDAIEKRGNPIIITNTYTSLTLFEYFFSKDAEPETQTRAEFERNLFKAYLVLNSQFTSKQNIAIDSTSHLEEEDRIPMMMFCTDYPISDKVHYDIVKIWVTQVVKSIYLFQFLESSPNTQILL